METNRLLQWYDDIRRDLPWRRTKDPYCIMISEVMLQQTQVKKVIPYYEAFISTFPTIQALASATEDEVLKLWAGLGYYSRGKRLRLCAQALMESYDGLFPQDLQKVLKLPGIGPYTAGAILSICYDYAAPAVDGNVFRVFSRYYNQRSDISLPATRKLYETMVMEVLPKRSGDFNQALMELGATVCTPQLPKCQLCPLNMTCQAYQKGYQKELPIKAKRIKNKVLYMEVGIVSCGSRILMMKRPPKGLLSDLWSFPIVEKDDAKDNGHAIQHELMDTFGLNLPSPELLGSDKHVFSHRTWNMKVYHFHADNTYSVDYPINQWLTLDDIKLLGLPTAFNKLVPLL